MTFAACYKKFTLSHRLFTFFLVLYSPTSVQHNRTETAPVMESSPNGPTDVAHVETLSSIPPENGTARSRVRFNSSANAEILPSEQNTLDPAGESEHAQTTGDQHTTNVEELLNAHNIDPTNFENYSSTTLNDTYDNTESYSVTGNTQGGVFYHLLQAYKTPVPAAQASESSTSVPISRPGSPSGAATPLRRKWYEQEKAARSHETLATLIGASAKLANPNEKKEQATHPPYHKRTGSSGILTKVWKAKEEKDAKIKVHVANILKRQQYIIRMCRALMLFGAPTHRLEEYLAMTAKVLEINSQFLYIPGCMIISFDDVLTHTAEVKIVRTAQGVNLGKLKDTHDIYKEVLHDVISLDDALARLDEVINAKDRHPVWLCVIMYGLASAAVSVFFKARWIDMPIIFALGILLGLMQLVLAPMSQTYSTVFEITATILMSCVARAFGSINDGSIFCFSAIAQSSIALILPGWVRMTAGLRSKYVFSRVLTPTACAKLCIGASVSCHCTGFDSTSFRHHLFLVPWLRHHGRYSHIWSYRLQRHKRNNLPKSLEPILELPFRSPLRLLHNLHCAG